MITDCTRSGWIRAIRTFASLGVALSMSTPSAADEVVLRQTFEASAGNALPADWPADGSIWSVRDGALYGTALDGEATVLLGEQAWRDVALAADVRFVNARDPKRWFALLLREGGPSAPGIQFTVRRDLRSRNGLELAARRAKGDGSGWRVFQTAAAPTDDQDDHDHHLRIEARGEWIRGFLNGEKVFDCPRGSEISDNGRLGFRISGCAVRVDNIEVSRLAPVPSAQRHLRTHPLIIAHRGFSYRAPENTLVAYRQAIQAGADMAECDVRLSADRVPVLLHDENLKRTTGLDAPVTSLPLAKLVELDAGSWKSPEFAGERIPTLCETLRLVNGKLRLVIEVKPAGMEREVLAAIREAGTDPCEVMIFSFKREVVETLARLEPQLPTTWLIGQMPWREEERRATIAQALSARVSAIGLPATRVDPAIVRMAHESGFPIFVWTVNDPADMRYLKRIGVDGIITDRPDVLLQILEPTGGQKGAA